MNIFWDEYTDHEKNTPIKNIPTSRNIFWDEYIDHEIKYTHQQEYILEWKAETWFQDPLFAEYTCIMDKF